MVGSDPGKNQKPPFMNLHGWVGLATIALAEFLLFQGVHWVKTFFTPLAWSGYILWMDGILLRKTGTSLIFDHRKEFAVLLPLSIGLWLIFEFYNLFFQNWHYVGLPEEILLRYFGYAWAFATIWPAILISAAMMGRTDWIQSQRIRPLSVRPLQLKISFLVGLGCLAVPFLLPEDLSRYTAGPVWLGFIFLLEPVNYRWGRYSLIQDLERGDPRRCYSLLLSGSLCGALWEFWNFWAGAKWHYTMPILGDINLFEMPVLGYLGFPPFALECFAMAGFLWNLAGSRKGAAWLQLCPNGR